MKRARFGVFFFGSGLTITRGKHANVAALLALTDPWTTMPQAALDHLDGIPQIVIDRKMTSASLAARVHFTTAAPEISSTGTAYRMDRIPLPVRQALRSPHATDEDILRGIHDALGAT